MSNIAVVQRMMDRVLVEDLERALDFIAEDVELTVVPAEPSAGSAESLRGKSAVREYFETLGGIVTFWQLRFVGDGDQVLVPGRESYVTNGGMQSDRDFLLVCQVRQGLITRLLVVEDATTTVEGSSEHVGTPLRPTIFREAPELDDGLAAALGAAVEDLYSSRQNATLFVGRCRCKRPARRRDARLVGQLRAAG